MKTMQLSVTRLSTWQSELRPAVHRMWPSLTSLLNGLKHESVESSALAELLKLISTITLTCGDFMSFKFKEDIMPFMKFSVERLRMTISSYEKATYRQLRRELLNLLEAFVGSESCQQYIRPVAYCISPWLLGLWEDLSSRSSPLSPPPLPPPSPPLPPPSPPPPLSPPYSDYKDDHDERKVQRLLGQLARLDPDAHLYLFQKHNSRPVKERHVPSREIGLLLGLCM